MIDELPDVTARMTELVELRAAFLVNTSKLAKICAAFGVSGSLPDSETEPYFTNAVNMLRERLAFNPDGLAAEIGALFGGNGLTHEEQLKLVADKLRTHRL